MMPARTLESSLAHVVDLLRTVRCDDTVRIGAHSRVAERVNREAERITITIGIFIPF